MSSIIAGPGAIDRPASIGISETTLSRAVPSNGNGILDTIQIRLNAGLDRTIYIGTFYGSGLSWTYRDHEILLLVNYGATRTFTGRSLRTYTNDIIGVYDPSSGSSIMTTNITGSGLMYLIGDHFLSEGNKTYSDSGFANTDMSIYATGDTASFKPRVIYV
jgi:hypothetical protein